MPKDIETKVSLFFKPAAEIVNNRALECLTAQNWRFFAPIFGIKKSTREYLKANKRSMKSKI